MEKIISLFKRDYEGTRLVYNEVVPGAEWVLAGEGVPTRKWDGTCCMVRSGVLYKRYDAKTGGQPPPGFDPAQEPDPITGHWPGWLPVGDGPEDKWHREAFARGHGHWPDATYELVGPRIQGDHEHRDCHELIIHGHYALENVPRDFIGIKHYLAANDIEGIVWHHSDGRMVKIKGRDFGIKRVRP